MSPRVWPVVLLVLSLAVGVALGLANGWMGELNQDEGWYLYAAGEVADGRLPYRDFAYTQGPVLPFVYALAIPWVESGGLAAGRILTALLGFLAAGIAGGLAWRVAARGWGLYAFCGTVLLLLANVYHSYFTTVVKTYSLASLFLTTGLLVLSAVRPGRRGWAQAMPAALLLVLAAGTRLSTGVFLPLAGLYLLFRRRSLGDAPWIGFGLAGGFALAVVFGTFFVLDPEASRFFLLEYHTARSGGEGMERLLFLAGFAARFIGAYWVLCLMVVGLVLALAFRVFPGFPAQKPSAPRGFLLLCWMGIGWLTVVHASAPFPYDDYQVVLAPLLAAAALAAWTRLLSREDVPPDEPVDEIHLRHARRRRAAAGGLTGVFLASLAAIGTSSIPQAWFIEGRDTIWWNTRDMSALPQLQQVARTIRQQVPEDGMLLTQDLYLAVEANRRVPPGFEMGPFSYYPDFSEERAEALHVLNRDRLEAVLRAAEAPMAAVSGYGFAIESPTVEPVPEPDQRALRDLLQEAYTPVETIPHFGQAHTPLTLYQRTPLSEDPASDPPPSGTSP